MSKNTKVENNEDSKAKKLALINAADEMAGKIFELQNQETCKKCIRFEELFRKNVNH